MSEKEGDNLELKWLRYLISKSKEQDAEIENLKKEIIEMKEKEEILGQSLLKVLENKED